MKNLFGLVGVVALATAVAAGAAAAAPPDGRGGGGSPGGPPKSLSQFSSPFIKCKVDYPYDCVPDTGANDDVDAEVAGSVGSIDSLGNWQVRTVDLVEYQEICIDVRDGGSAPVSAESLPFLLGTVGATSTENASGTIHPDGRGNWQGLSLQVRDWNGVDCRGAIRQQTGINLTANGEWFSEISSPFVVDRGVEVPGSTGTIENDSDWLVLTYVEYSKEKYSVCVNAVSAPVDTSVTSFLLSDRNSQRNKTFYSVGKIFNRHPEAAGYWIGMTMQIYHAALSCDNLDLEQEFGITITE